VVHRKDLQKAIVDGCYKHPSIKFRMGHTILRVDYEKNRVLVKDNTKMSSSQTEKAEQAQTKNESVGAESKAVGEEGAEWFEADVILGADGVRSVARRDMLKLEGEEDHSE
jgi:salicylate hydroxylase